MKRTISAIALAGLAGASSLGFAQGTSWPKEPAAVFGIKFGSKISADDMRPCGDIRPDANLAEKPISVCRMGDISDRIELGAFPILEFRFGTLELEDGRATQMFITGWHDNYAAIRSVLIERYGKPTSRAVSEVHTKAGAPYKAEQLTWQGKRLLIKLDEFAGDINTSSVHFAYIPALAASIQRDKAAAKREASKL